MKSLKSIAEVFKKEFEKLLIDLENNPDTYEFGKYFCEH